MVSSIATEIEAHVRANFTVIDLVLNDISGNCGSSFVLVIVSDDFKPMKLLERHQKV